jgi:hypothetical protein
MVQDVGDIISLKILHLQDPVKVLQSLIIVGYMGRQVTIDDADIVAIKFQADVDSPFIPPVPVEASRSGFCREDLDEGQMLILGKDQ